MYESKLKNEHNDELFKAILKLKNLEDCYRFFEDICTVHEVDAVAQRLRVAKMLSEGKTYTEIEKETNVSTATISRISHCLEGGAEGYKLALKKNKM